MRKLFVSLLFFVLAACASGASQYQLNAAMQKADDAGFQCITSIGEHVTFFKVAQCQNAAYQQYVMPVYPYKGLLADFMATRKEIALKVDAGKLTPEQGDVEEQKAFAKLVAVEEQSNSAKAAQNVQAWQDYSARMQQLSGQVMQAETERYKAQQKNQRIMTNTNCEIWNNTMNCTTR